MSAQAPPAGQGGIPYVDPEDGTPYDLPLAPVEGAVPFVEDDEIPAPFGLEGSLAFVDVV